MESSMRIEGNKLVFSVKPVVRASPEKWEEVLSTAGIDHPRVTAVDREVIEVRIGKEKGIAVSRERVRSLEQVIRGNVGQVLQN